MLCARLQWIHLIPAEDRTARSIGNKWREIAKLELTDAAIVDCTADESVVAAYGDFVRANLHIITPNKRANVLPWSDYAALMQLLRARQKYFLDEANVGAGLPIMSTIRDLISSGEYSNTGIPARAAATKTTPRT